MIRPTHLIRRTAVIVANLTPDPILGLTAKAVCWLRRDAYFEGAQAAIRGDDWMAVAEGAGCAVEPMTPAEAFRQYDAAVQAEEDAVAADIAEYRDRLYHDLVTYYVDQHADELDTGDYFAWLERQFHPSNGGAL